MTVQFQTLSALQAGASELYPNHWGGRKPTASLNSAQKPIAACHGKQLKLHAQGTSVFAAHKQMFVGVAFAIGVGEC
jgi:hypothetical protein